MSYSGSTVLLWLPCVIQNRIFCFKNICIYTLYIYIFIYHVHIHPQYIDFQAIYTSTTTNLSRPMYKRATSQAKYTQHIKHARYSIQEYDMNHDMRSIAQNANRMKEKR